GYIHEHMGTRNLNELQGLRNRMPMTAVLLVLASLAAMAIPGLSNFISEYLVIAGALTANPIFALSIIAPALTVGYFLWMIRRVVLTPAAGPVNDLHLHSLLILAAFLVPLFILAAYPAPLLNNIIQPTVVAFLGPAGGH
ncbi:MAG TPA: proton-conducting transporter membrane subunit, partial [Candidatus Binatus sp.]|nr:proton-conducting transporter membrane subunit [Candidatus Binatus sp.]